MHVCLFISNLKHIISNGLSLFSGVLFLNCVHISMEVMLISIDNKFVNNYHAMSLLSF